MNPKIIYNVFIARGIGYGEFQTGQRRDQKSFPRT